MVDFSWFDILLLFILVVIIGIGISVIVGLIESRSHTEKTGGGRKKKYKTKPIIRQPITTTGEVKGILAVKSSTDEIDVVDNEYKNKDIEKNLKLYPRSKSEAIIIGYLESATGEKFPTVYPTWLVWRGHRLELDGYNDKLKIAMEFSGPLHTKWAPSVESYEKYFARIVRDVVKKKMCKRKGIGFFTVDVSLPSRHWFAYTMSRLYDISSSSRSDVKQSSRSDVKQSSQVSDGIDKPGNFTKPADYIPEQKVKPYRNKQIERELGLDAEWKAAKAL